VADSRMLEIIRRLSEATPPPIRLSRLIQSPAQGYFSFMLRNEHRDVAVRLFQALGKASVNLRYLSEHLGENGRARFQLCCDTEAQAQVLKLLQADDAADRIEAFCHVEEALVLSLYPFDGQPELAGRVFGVLKQLGIRMLGASTATAVFSCVISSRDTATLIAGLREVFLWE